MMLSFGFFTNVMSLDQHPVPQNVTTFQFRLIGDMTIKQFAYLAFGAILAFVSFKLPLPFLITWPLTGAFALLGVGFAFMPIEDRPMDIWVFSFLKNVYSPTVFVWKKRGKAMVETATQLPQVAANPTPATRSALTMPVSPRPLTSVMQPATSASTTKNATKPPQPPVTAINTPTAPAANTPPTPLSTSRASWNPFGWLLSIFSPKQKIASTQPSQMTREEKLVIPATPVMFRMTKPQVSQPVTPIVTPSVSGYRPKDEPPQEPSSLLSLDQ
jgi:hypothetical protein